MTWPDDWDGFEIAARKLGDVGLQYIFMVKAGFIKANYDHWTLDESDSGRALWNLCKSHAEIGNKGPERPVTTFPSLLEYIIAGAPNRRRKTCDACQSYRKTCQIMRLRLGKLLENIGDSK